MKKVSIFTDGSCLGNPGPGGWAAILCLVGTEHTREMAGGFRLTTNNRMEILAAIKGLQALKEPCEVSLFTDSQYLRNAVEKGWLKAWRGKNWQKANKKPVLNVDLWQELLPELGRHEVRIMWLKGHAGQRENERCDMLAREFAGRKDLEADIVFENLQGSPA